MRANRSMPSSTVIPVLPYEDVGEAVDWLCEKFGFAVRWKAGGHRAQLAVGDGAVAVTEHGSGPRLERAGSVVMVRVEDAAAHHERSLRSGARIVQPLSDFPYGERQYTAEDLGGHRWTFSETIADVAPEDWGGASG